MSMVGPVIVEKVYASYARENYAALLGEQAPAKLEDVIAGLQQHFSSVPKTDLMQCDGCGGWSPDALDSCPYCNDGKAGAATPPPPPPPPARVDGPKESTALTKSTAPALFAVPATRNLDVPPPAEFAVSTRPPLAFFETAAVTEENLARLEDAIRDSIAASHECAWNAGWLLNQAHRYYEQRRSDNGTPKYGRLEDWCRAELGITKQHMYRLVHVATHYSAEEVRTHGATKLYALRALEPAERTTLLASSELATTSVAKTKEIVAKRRPKPAKTKLQRDREHEAAIKEALANPIPGQTAAITAGYKAIELVIPLRKSRKPITDAVDLAGARAMEEAINGVRLSYTIEERKGGFVIVRTAKREKEDGKEGDNG